jgi:hypothetical protein
LLQEVQVWEPAQPHKATVETMVAAARDMVQQAAAVAVQTVVQAAQVMETEPSVEAKVAASQAVHILQLPEGTVADTSKFMRIQSSLTAQLRQMEETETPAVKPQAEPVRVALAEAAVQVVLF